jgi:hypothetical protein
MMVAPRVNRGAALNFFRKERSKTSREMEKDYDIDRSKVTCLNFVLFCPEDAGNPFLCNVCTCQPDSMA